jgi:hypothetical protein
LDAGFIAAFKAMLELFWRLYDCARRSARASTGGGALSDFFIEAWRQGAPAIAGAGGAG